MLSAAADQLDMELVSETRGQRMSPALPDTFSVVKQEEATGFLQSLREADEDCSEEVHSRLIKEELNCVVQLRMLQQGKEISLQDEPRQYTISEETLQLQNDRRAKNREAAKKCRRKKKQRKEWLLKNVKNLEKCKQEMQQELQKLRAEYSANLQRLATRECFKLYIRQNPQLLKVEGSTKQAVEGFAGTAYHRLPSGRCRCAGC